MTTIKTLTLSAILGFGLIGAASAQVYPGTAGSPGRGNSDPVVYMPNGGVVSNGYMAEPGDFARSRAALSDARELPAPSARSNASTW